MKMHKQLLGLLFGFFSQETFALEVIEPELLQQSVISISDPDRHIKTLGRVEFIIDLSAAHDVLLALKVRRSSLTLKDGRAFSAFGVHKEAGLIVLAGGDVTHVSIAHVDGQEAHVLFYGKNNEVVSPPADDVAVFDTDFKALDFSYTPLQTPGTLEIPVTIALDISGSMKDHLRSVIYATRDFLSNLPEFTRCRLLTFSDDVQYLTPLDTSRLVSCPSSQQLLRTNLQTGGRTALYKAIRTGFAATPVRQGNTANIVIVITDGMDTVSFSETMANLKALKNRSSSKLFVFWAGNYEKDHLQGLADLEFVSTNNLESELEIFFRSLGVSLSGLQTLQVRR